MKKALKYAKTRIEVQIEEMGNIQRIFISQGNLYIEFENGRNFQLSEDEVKYQATEHLNSEIEEIEQG